MERTSDAGTLEWLDLLKEAQSLLVSIADALSKLKEKRVTLEEKMIARYMHEWAAQTARLVAQIHEKSASTADPLTPAQLVSLKELNELMLEEIKAFHKAIDHNPNYLEQYFEHSYLIRLKEERLFPERLSELASDIAR